MLHREVRLKFARSAPALGFRISQDNGALVRNEHACPVPDGLSPGKRKSSGPIPFHQAGFGLFGEPLKPIRVEPADTVSSAGMFACPRSNPRSNSCGE